MMASGGIDSTLIDLSDRGLKEIPQDVLQQCDKIRALVLSRNPCIQVENVLRFFKNVTSLNLNRCELHSVPDEIRELSQLEHLYLGENIFDNGLNPNIGLLRQLKTLSLINCGLTSVPDWIENMEMLELLFLSGNRFDNGLNPKMGQLRQLTTLHLSSCQLKSIPDFVENLEMLENLNLHHNNFHNGLNSNIGRLCQLKTLGLDYCGLTSVPNWIGNLQMLKELDLGGNFFEKELNPNIGRLRQLKILNLSVCKLTSIPDWIGNMDTLEELHLSNNCLTEYPSCTLRLRLLHRLNLSHFWQQTVGNGISALPIELLNTNLQELKLENNPITEPPKRIWKQGIDAIRSYFKEQLHGSNCVCPDTINMIGDVFSGKTSIAQSLVEGAPHPAAEDDRTRVMQQLRARFGDNDELRVNINDFGGHQIYHAVIPIFLPTDGLVVLAYDMSRPVKDQECAVRQWFLTVLAKSKFIRVIVVGTRSDKISLQERERLEKHMQKFISSLLKQVKYEVGHHAKYVKRLEFCELNEKKLQHLQDLLARFEGARTSVVSLSCLKPDEGLVSLRDIVSKELRPAVSMPRRWFRVMKKIRNGSSNRPYLTWDEVQKLYREEVVNTDDDDKDLVVILRYLASTSQIFWLEHHTMLKKFVFHSTQRILKICKDVLDHDHVRQWAAQWDEMHSKDIQLYSKGIVHHRFLTALFSNEDIETVAIPFFQNFNLISEIVADNGSRSYVIPSNLPAEEPPEMSQLQLQLDKCPNSVVIKLSFLGSVLPMSFLETSISLLLTIAKGLATEGVSTHVWRHGLIILYDSACFAAQRKENVLIFAAFSDRSITSPWAIMMPIMRSLHENVTAYWHGAPPECALACPTCRLNGTKKVGEIETTLETLASETQHQRAQLVCPECLKTMPLNLCFSTAKGADQMIETSELVKRVKEVKSHLVSNLDRHSVMAVVDELQASHHGVWLITDDHRQEIQAATTDTEKARMLLNMVCSRGDEAIRVLVKALRSDAVKRPDLAMLILRPTEEQVVHPTMAESELR